MSRIYLIIVFLAAGTISRAQDIKAVLVQLSSEQNRIRYFHKHNKAINELDIAVEAKKIRSVTIADFTDNFVYCPVYYYMDTNETFIRNKQFAGKLLDAKGNVVEAPVINSADSDYVIVYYGYPDQEKSEVTEHKGLVILNDQFMQIYFLFKGIKNASQEAKSNAKYAYLSPKYDMGYLPFAARFNQKIGRTLKRMEKYRD